MVYVALDFSKRGLVAVFRLMVVKVEVLLEVAAGCELKAAAVVVVLSKLYLAPMMFGEIGLSGSIKPRVVIGSKLACAWLLFYVWLWIAQLQAC